MSKFSDRLQRDIAKLEKEKKYNKATDKELKRLSALNELLRAYLAHSLPAPQDEMHTQDTVSDL